MSEQRPSLPIPAHDVATAVAMLGVQVEQLLRVTEQLAADVRQDRQTYVTQQLWEQRNRSVDMSVAAQGREIADLRTEQRSRRVPWPAVGAVVLAGAALLLQLIQALGQP